MSGIKALDKLRMAARNMAKGRNLENHEECNLLLIIAGEIKAEIERDYMRLPVDADGVPIRVGDKLMTDNKDSSLYGRELFVTAVSEHHIHYQTLPYEGDGHYRTGCLANIRHVKPRTLEDVLQELEGLRGYGNSTYEDVVTRASELADEIRELLDRRYGDSGFQGDLKCAVERAVRHG